MTGRRPSVLLAQQSLCYFRVRFRLLMWYWVITLSNMKPLPLHIVDLQCTVFSWHNIGSSFTLSHTPGVCLLDMPFCWMRHYLLILFEKEVSTLSVLSCATVSRLACRLSQFLQRIIHSGSPRDYLLQACYADCLRWRSLPPDSRLPILVGSMQYLRETTFHALLKVRTGFLEWLFGILLLLAF